MGKTEAKLVKLAERSKEKIPERIANAPTLTAGLEFFYLAFWDLHTTRGIGMGEGYIPITAMQTYGDRMGLDDDTQELLEYLVKSMDIEYIAFRQRQSEKGKNRAQKGAKTK
jgi:hypothetical protein